MVRVEKSVVISLKLTMSEYILWDFIREVQQLSFSEFIKSYVDYFLIHNLPQPLSREISFARLSEKFHEVQSSTGLKTMTFRIKRSELKIWDDYCKIRYLTRTSLIKQAVNGSIDPQIGRFLKLTDPETIRLRNIVKNIIQRIGLIDFEDLNSIFEEIDPRILTYILNSLEEKGEIGRKGRDTYVPANPASGVTDVVLMAGNLGRIIEQLRYNPEELDNPDQLFLYDGIAKYLMGILKNLEISRRKVTKTQIAHFRENLSQIIGDLRQLITGSDTTVNYRK